MKSDLIINDRADKEDFCDPRDFRVTVDIDVKVKCSKYYSVCYSIWYTGIQFLYKSLVSTVFRPEDELIVRNTVKYKSNQCKILSINKEIIINESFKPQLQAW